MRGTLAAPGQPPVRTLAGVALVSFRVVQMQKRSTELIAALRELLGEIEPLPMVLDYESAAAQLSISPSTLKRMVRSGEIEAVPVAKRMGIPRSELERISLGIPSPHARAVSEARARAKMVPANKAAFRAVAKKI